MKLHHVKASVFQGQSGVAEVLGDLLHVCNGHGTDGNTTGLYIVDGTHGLVAKVVLRDT